MRLKTFFAFSILLFAILACNVQTVTPTPSPLAGTEPPVPPVTVAVTEPPVPPATATNTPVPPPLPVISSPVLVQIDFQDASNGWGVVVNDSGSILRTADGGATWLNATPPGVGSIGYSARLTALNTNTVWVLIPGADFFTGMLYRTTDGGITWTSNPVPFGGANLQFLDASTGRALANRGAGAGSEAVELFQTSDGGATWVSVFHNDPTQPGSSDSLPLNGIKNGMTFLDANTGWVTGTRPVGGEIYLYVTHDGGVSWAMQPIPLPAGYETNWYTPSVPIFFGQDGFLPLTISYPAGNIEQVFYVTHDGGATWSGDPTDASKVIMPGLPAFADALHIWSWDGGTNLYFTTDGAQIWGGTIANLDLSGRLSQLEFVPGPAGQFTGWALTSVDDSGHSQSYRTTDNGATWTPLIP
jgi:photosystem II stability/assembly factor-like uncharacterized protein